MNRFLKDRENCNRNDELQFKVKHEIYKYYCHRDSANVLRKALKKDDGFDESELQQAKAATLENYINSMPFFMYNMLSEEEKENHFRRKNRFIELVVDYLTEIEALPGLEWRTNAYTERWHKTNSSKPHFKPILKKTYLFKTKRDLVFGDKWKTKEDEIECRLQLENGVKAQIRIGKHLLTHWLALCFFSKQKPHDIIAHFKAYCTAYYNCIEAAKYNRKPKHTDIEMLEKLYGKNFAGNRKLQKLFKTGDETEKKYKVLVKKKLKARIAYFEEMKKQYGQETTLLHSLQQDETFA